MTTLPRFSNPESLREYVQRLQQSPQANAKQVLVCFGSACLASGAREVAEALEKELERVGSTDVKVGAVMKRTGCHGFCDQGPLVIVMPEGTYYTHVKPKDVKEIVDKTLVAGEPVERLMYKDPATGEIKKTFDQIEFYARQRRVAMRNVGQIDPENLDDYLLRGGYAALAKALTEMSDEQVLETIEKAHLRGRGGGGFDAGKKWRHCRRAVDPTKYVICNGDEGDPGAFMDEAIMVGDPHAVIEGMIIGAYAVGSHQGFIYVRQEYPRAVAHLNTAIEQAREAGLLGENILGTGFSFDIEIARGGGAFVCGESSALMRSVEGKVGEPRAKYIHATDRGLWDKPTVLNNVETWTNVPIIIEKGAEWFTSMGTERSKGTKAFALVGKVKNTGIVEVEMGTTLREIIFGPGGGMLNDGPKGKFKAVQTGGPSGGCLPESKLDMPVDFDSLTEAGSMMGSGGMIVMDQSTCMVDVARYFLKFLVDESCGKCVPCREGLYQMYRIVDRICEGKGKPEDLDKIEDLAKAVQLGSLCGLGKSGPNPVLSTLRYFREEYEAHIYDKKCPAGVCKALITYKIDNSKCDGCNACVVACASNAITGEVRKGETYHIDPDKCDRCGACIAACTRGAIFTE